MTTQDSNNPVDSARELQAIIKDKLSIIAFGEAYKWLFDTDKEKVCSWTYDLEKLFASKLEEIGARVLGDSEGYRSMAPEEHSVTYQNYELSRQARNTLRREQKARLATEIERLKK